MPPSVSGTETARPGGPAAAPAPCEGSHGAQALRVVIPSDRPLHEVVRQFKRELITMTLEATRGNRSEAARRLGIQRTYLQRLIRELQIQIPPSRPRADRSPRRPEMP